MPHAYQVLTFDERMAVMRRLQLVLRAKMHERTGGRRGGVRAESIELAEECGCSHWAIQRYLGWTGPLSRQKGGRSVTSVTAYPPRFDLLIRVAAITGVSLDWIAFGRGPVPACVRKLPARPDAQESAA